MRVKLDEGAYMPERGHGDDAGLDLRSRESKSIPAWGSATFDTGVHVELPPGTFGKLESKSGLNVKHNVVSCGGVIDRGYTGSIVVKLYNLSGEAYPVVAGDKIVQMIVQPYCQPSLFASEELDETERGDKGFGSTGR